MIALKKHADALGFRRVYLLKPAPYPYFAKRKKEGTLHHNSSRITDDPMRDYPWANAVVLLLYPYHPYAPSIPVSGYYTASNCSYHAAGALLQYLVQRGIRAERVAVPVRETLLRHQIGIACKNGLTAVDPFGTRFVVQTAMVSLPDDMLPFRINSLSDTFRTCPESCDLCHHACPSHAISNTGMQYPLCIRSEMEGKQMQPDTMKSVQCLLGCECCQFVCPLNAKISVKNEYPEAFLLEKILTGDVNPAYERIGKNMRSGGRLEQQALILAANQNRKDLLPYISAWCSDPRPQVACAAAYAISILQSLQE